MIVNARLLEEMCREVLDGFGDAALGEWTEDRPKAFHLRRRLSTEEEKRVGPAVDCRGGDEATLRFEKMKRILPPQMWTIAMEELSEVAGS